MKFSLLLIGILSFLLLSCTAEEEDEETVSVTELDVALVTEGVSSVSTSSDQLEPAAIDIGGSCTGCAQSASLMASFTNGALSLMGLPDALTCMIEAMTETQVISGLGDGQQYYIEDTEDGSTELTRVAVTVANSEITSYTVANCTNGTQDGYISYSLSGGTATFTAKFNNDSGSPFKVTASGSYSSGSWTSKTVTIVEDGSSSDSHYTFTQHSNYVSVGLTSDSVQFYGEAALTGSNVSDYALGAGSVKSNVLSLTHFDENGASTSTASAYESSVNSASYPSTADVSDVSPSGDEVFSCSVPSGQSLSEFTGGTATLTEFSLRWQACQQLVRDSE